MYAIMNELSLRRDLSDEMTVEEVHRTIESFADAFQMLHCKKYIEGLISVPDFCTFELTTGYGISQWLASPEVEERYKRVIRSIMNRCSWLGTEQYGLSELKVDCGVSQENAVGCLAAYERGENVVSFGTHELWRAERIFGNYYSIDETTEEETFSDIQVENYAPERFIALRKSAHEQLFSEVSSGLDLWEQKEILFPHLRFCDSVKNQLVNDPERFHIVQVMKRLQRMNDYFANCNGIYDPKTLGFDARTESETVRNDSELKEYRKFQLPDGSFSYFFDHLGFSGKYCGRIHYLPNAQNGVCTIGYIGKHLKTKKYKGG